jgi:hypothetical protein
MRNLPAINMHVAIKVITLNNCFVSLSPSYLWADSPQHRPVKYAASNEDIKILFHRRMLGSQNSSVISLYILSLNSFVDGHVKL